MQNYFNKHRLMPLLTSTTVAHRLKVLVGLNLLLFDTESKKQLLERRQLHRILAENTWLFGEEFNLTVDDQSLTELLKEHQQFLGKEVDVMDEVRREDGSKGFSTLYLEGHSYTTRRRKGTSSYRIKTSKLKTKTTSLSIRSKVMLSL